jgi:hypothetical protein
VRLGAAEEGRQVLDDAIRQLRPGMKIQSRCSPAWPARNLRQRNPDQACQIDDDSLAVALASETEPSLQDFQLLRTEMRPWGSHRSRPGVRRSIDTLRAGGAGGGPASASRRR